jgi:hypothetical protein
LQPADHLPKSPDDLQEDLNEGAAGSWLAKVVEEKAARIDRMLNFLVQTDKPSNRQRMLEGARDDRPVDQNHRITGKISRKNSGLKIRKKP